MVVVGHSMERAEAHSVFAANQWPTRLFSWLPSLDLGVPIFFVISGYCISATADATRRSGRSTASYFKRRFRRIFPPYVIFVLSSALLIGLAYRVCPSLFGDDTLPLRRPWTFTPWQVVGNLTLTEGWLGYFVRAPGQWFMPHAWTLGYEEQFYAVTGLILLLTPRAFFASVCAISAGVLITQNYSPPGFFFDGLWLEFAAGVFVYYASVYATRRQAIGVAVVLAICIVGTFVFPYGGRHATAASILHHRKHDLAAFTTALIMLIARQWDEAIAEWTILRPLTFCGVLCYSIYLVHIPICKAAMHLLWWAGIQSDAATRFVTIPICVALSVATGLFFHVFVERKFLNGPQTPRADR
jgi:peptidoglycan/LPS O-acetylase OafA/YrhL